MEVKIKTLVWKQLSHSAWPYWHGHIDMQNRRQKVFNRGLCFSAGGFAFVREGLTFKNWQKLHWVILFHFSIWRGLELCLGGAKPTKATPWPRDCWHVLSPVFLFVISGFCLLFGWMLFLAESLSSLWNIFSW